MGDKRMDVLVLGRMLGTASGWDEAGDIPVHFYDFQPADGVNFPACGCLWTDFEGGRIMLFLGDDDFVSIADLVTLLAAIPRAKPL